MQKNIEYLKSSWKYIYIMSGIFIISVIAGLLISLKDLGLPENYLEIFKNSFGWIKTLSPLSIMLVIFLNNAVKSLFAIVLGAGFGIIPIIFVGGNGIILGLIANGVSKQQGIIFVLAALVPHGIIEIPMILISAGLGLRLGYFMYLSLRGEKKDMRSELSGSLRLYMRLIMPLLFVSAMIETFITPVILMWVSG
ncbi:MAG TPA: stage II sporulation protein M [Candidatus Methanoperedens sp.]|nr:stage II sporulation protein M [Candidatus Methanoperedens sp.]